MKEDLSKFETFEETAKYLIEEGYIREDLTPIKCVDCGSTELEDFGHMYEDCYLVEYSVHCVRCGKIQGTWSYGGWSL